MWVCVFVCICIYTIMVDLHCCMAETNTIFLQLKNKF